jgi:SMI1 / KNR4 family (SUKH-1)
MKFNEQLQRIESKLIKAKKADKDLKVFGASGHKYKLNRPATAREVISFETKYGIQLPECYSAFITHTGNGGESYASSAAGPFYGIYPLGENVDELVYTNIKESVANECVIYPKMTDEYWKSLTKNIDENDDISDSDFEQELSRIYAGILPIGSQGCAYLHGIILNGTYKGRIVNLDADRQKPRFAFEGNFLDWYERWLDEVISGELVTDVPSWFGYCKGGSPDELWATYLSSKSMEDREDCLAGLLNKSYLPMAIINHISLAIDNNPEDRVDLIQLLCKSDYELSKYYLIELAKTDLLSVFKFIYWYARDKSHEWLNYIKDNIVRINDEEIFRFCTYLLRESQTDYSSLIIPFTKGDKESIKVQAFYTLGQLSNKKHYLETFIEGLKDESNRVVHSTLQALDGVKDGRLLEYYKLMLRSHFGQHVMHGFESAQIKLGFEAKMANA